MEKYSAYVYRVFIYFFADTKFTDNRVLLYCHVCSCTYGYYNATALAIASLPPYEEKPKVRGVAARTSIAQSLLLRSPYRPERAQLEILYQGFSNEAKPWLSRAKKTSCWNHNSTTRCFFSLVRTARQLVRVEFKRQTLMPQARL